MNRRKTQANQDPEADFFRVAAWGKMGEVCQKYLAKGKKVSVTGSVSVHAYTDKNGNAAGNLEVFAQDVEFLSPVGGNGGEQTTSTSAPSVPAADPSGFSAVETDELPF